MLGNHSTAELHLQLWSENSLYNTVTRDLGQYLRSVSVGEQGKSWCKQLEEGLPWGKQLTPWDQEGNFTGPLVFPGVYNFRGGGNTRAGVEAGEGHMQQSVLAQIWAKTTRLLSGFWLRGLNLWVLQCGERLWEIPHWGKKPTLVTATTCWGLLRPSSPVLFNVKPLLSQCDTQHCPKILFVTTHEMITYMIGPKYKKKLNTTDIQDISQHVVSGYVSLEPGLLDTYCI